MGLIVGNGIQFRGRPDGPWRLDVPEDGEQAEGLLWQSCRWWIWIMMAAFTGVPAVLMLGLGLIDGILYFVKLGSVFAVLPVCFLLLAWRSSTQRAVATLSRDGRISLRQWGVLSRTLEIDDIVRRITVSPNDKYWFVDADLVSGKYSIGLGIQSEFEAANELAEKISELVGGVPVDLDEPMHHAGILNS